jgi:hypothetical protein
VINSSVCAGRLVKLGSFINRFLVGIGKILTTKNIYHEGNEEHEVFILVFLSELPIPFVYAKTGFIVD